MATDYRRMAQKYLQSRGGVGGPLQIIPQTGVPMNQRIGIPQIYPSQVGMPAAQQTPGNGDGVIVRYNNQAYKSGGLTYSAFPVVTVPNGTTNLEINIPVRRPFLPQLWYMPSTTFGLIINDFTVEGMGLFASPVATTAGGIIGVPNELVSEVSNMPQIQWPTIDPSTNGNFLVSNQSGADLIFSGAFWGTNLIRT